MGSNGRWVMKFGMSGGDASGAPLSRVPCEQCEQTDVHKGLKMSKGVYAEIVLENLRTQGL